jgi:hypothetical protein
MTGYGTSRRIILRALSPTLLARANEVIERLEFTSGFGGSPDIGSVTSWGD